ncbi:hypothetical protein PR048_001792 [Dryococelus australis]|uniref:Secreted protein n=1 Tax=Dryococelus australis TaxID=614101 RepID=A0ABQ9IID0_9NEOP|nr:hypothetical protein PR048_001792 [Dryococelus australis]
MIRLVTTFSFSFPSAQWGRTEQKWSRTQGLVTYIGAWAGKSPIRFFCTMRGAGHCFLCRLRLTKRAATLTEIVEATAEEMLRKRSARREDNGWLTDDL